MSLAERSSREQRLVNAAAIVDCCRKCAIGEARRNSVYGEGDPCAELMVVGEGPARDDLARLCPKAIFLGAKQGEELTDLDAKVDAIDRHLGHQYGLDQVL